MPSRKWGTKELAFSPACQQKGRGDVGDDLIEKMAFNGSSKVLIQQMKGVGGAEIKAQRHKQYRSPGNQQGQA